MTIEFRNTISIAEKQKAYQEIRGHQNDTTGKITEHNAAGSGQLRGGRRQSAGGTGRAGGMLLSGGDGGPGREPTHEQGYDLPALFPE